MPESRNNSRLLLRDLLGRNTGGWILALTSVILSAVLLLLLPPWTKTLIYQVLPGKSRPALIRHLELGLAIIVFSQAFSFLWDNFRMRRTHEVSRLVRQRLYEKILSLPWNYFNTHRSGEIVSRLSNDLKTLEEGLFWGILAFIPSALILIGLFSLMIYYSPLLGSLSVALLLPAISLITRFMRGLRKNLQGGQKTLARLNHLAEETVRGIREIKIFQMSDRVSALFSRHNNENFSVHIKADRLRVRGMNIVPLLIYAGFMAVVFVSNELSRSSLLRSETLVAALTCFLLAIMPAVRLSYALGFSSRIFAALDRCREILEIPSEEAPVAGPSPALRPPLGPENPIVFENVSFSYSGRRILENIGLKIRGGETIVIVGPNGAGKTTLLNLIPRFMDPESGVIRWGNSDISDLSLDHLRKQIAYLSQEPILLDDSLYENIAAGRPGADRAEILAAAVSSHVHDFARDLPRGYETYIGPYGSYLSRGQKQRVALARIFLKDSPLVLLDEPMSFLDRESEMLIRDSLNALHRQKTIAITTHQRSVLPAHDRVYLLDRKRLTEMEL